VNELDDGGGIDVPLAGVAAGTRRKKHQKGAKALAPGIYDVTGYLVDQRYLAMQTLFDHPVDGLEISIYQATNLF
jgi:hypothetical protein